MKTFLTDYSVSCLATKIFLDTIRLLGAHNLSKKFDFRRSPKVGQTRVIPNSRKKYLKTKLGPLQSTYTNKQCRNPSNWHSDITSRGLIFSSFRKSEKLYGKSFLILKNYLTSVTLYFQLLDHGLDPNEGITLQNESSVVAEFIKKTYTRWQYDKYIAQRLNSNVLLDQAWRSYWSASPYKYRWSPRGGSNLALPWTIFGYALNSWKTDDHIKEIEALIASGADLNGSRPHSTCSSKPFFCLCRF